MKSKYLPIVLIIFTCFVVISFCVLKNTEYVPIIAIRISDTFVNLLKTNNFEQAYTLTNKNAIIGPTFTDFLKKIHKDWLNYGGGPDCKIERRFTFPVQTYGNRLRRFVEKSQTEMDQINVEYYIGAGHPFRISLKFGSDGVWRISNFQIHDE